MSGVIIIGSQWGDEGKGKAIDAFSSQVDYVVRYHGGANAGHTLNVDGQKRVLHLLPSGILHTHVRCLISAGVALDIFTLIKEIKELKKAGFLENDSNLMISSSAVLLLDYHKTLDQVRDLSQKIATTKRGVGPAYEDRSSRKALVFGDLFLDENKLQEKLEASTRENFFLIENFYKQKPPSIENLMEELKKARDFLAKYKSDETSLVIHQALEGGKRVLFEGAQGALLDLFHGTYPYVTSSSTLAGSALTGCGIGWGRIKKVLAIMKAYTTRVGSGPFPSECDGEERAYLEERGQEKGSTTGRRRRCGWLDLPALKYALRLNGADRLALMKLDVLSGLKTIKVCTSYLLDGANREYPVSLEALKKCTPVYKEFEGFDEDLRKCRSLEDLPVQVREYVEFIEQELEAKVDMISVGPGRDETLWIRPLFD